MAERVSRDDPSYNLKTAATQLRKAARLLTKVSGMPVGEERRKKLVETNALINVVQARLGAEK